jgi:hypothetical protein
MKINDLGNNQNGAGPLPEMETYEDAEAISEKEHDHFYLCAFMMKSWLQGLVLDAAIRLPPLNQLGKPAPQTGQGWKGFLDIFGQLSDAQFHYSIRAVLRFLKYDDAGSDLLLRAQVPLTIEHLLRDASPELGVVPMPKQPCEAVLPMRGDAERWCDWLDALIHLETYGQAQLSLDRLDVDLSSEFVSFGYPLCKLPDENHSSDAGPQGWPRREIDTFLIALQPLAKHYHWSCEDLLNVVRKLVSQPQDHPCWSKRDLASYRHQVLALPPLPSGPAKLPVPAGFEAARQICPPLFFPSLAQPFWS